MKCELCGKEPEMFWKDKERKNGRSETFYTNKDGKIVCVNCLGHTPKTLQQLNKERKNNS